MYYILYVSPICLPNSRSYFLASIGVISFALFNNFKSLGRSLEKFRNSRNLRIGANACFSRDICLLFFFFFHEAPFRVERYRYEFSTGTNGIKDSFFVALYAQRTTTTARCLTFRSLERVHSLLVRGKKQVIGLLTMHLSSSPIRRPTFFFVNNFAVKILLKGKHSKETLFRDYFSSPTF